MKKNAEKEEEKKCWNFNLHLIWMEISIWLVTIMVTFKIQSIQFNMKKRAFINNLMRHSHFNLSRISYCMQHCSVFFLLHIFFSRTINNYLLFNWNINYALCVQLSIYLQLNSELMLNSTSAHKFSLSFCWNYTYNWWINSVHSQLQINWQIENSSIKSVAKRIYNRISLYTTNQL